MSRWFIIILALSCLGCVADFSEIRKSPPKLSLRSSKPPEQLANCVLYEAKNYSSIWFGGSPNITLVKREGAYYLIVGLGEVSFKPTSDGGSEVEYRSDGVFTDQGSRFIWDYVEKCK